MKIQLSFFESIMDYLFCLEPIFFFGFFLVGLLLYFVLKKDKSLRKIRIIISSILMYYYCYIILKNIVGIPTVSEFSRLSKLGESFFNPNINLIPLSDGLSLNFILNICLFIPLGFFPPIISKTYERVKNDLLLGFGLSLMIEISQLFTLYRVTEIDDFISNVFGTLLGYFCYKLITNFKFIKTNSDYNISLKKDFSKFIPIIVIVFAFVITFIS